MTIGMALGGKVDFSLNELNEQYNIKTWIAVDGGYNHLQKENIVPEIIIGDMDSIDSVPAKIPTLEFDPIKDFTDFDLSIKYVAEHYPKTQIVVVGVSSNERLEHFIANLKLMTDKMVFITKHNTIQQFSNSFNLQLEPGQQFSLFAKSPVSKLNISQAKWELTDYDLDVNDSLTISNESIGKPIEIAFLSGVIQLYLARD